MDLASLLVLAAAALSVGLVAAFAQAAWRAARRPRVIALMYHRVVPRERWRRTRGSERVFTLPTDAFDAQLGALAADGWRFVGADEVAAHARRERILAHRSVLVTIDDGCASAHAEILPVVVRRGGRAILFVTTDPASAIFSLGEGERRVTDHELRELVRAGIEVGSHAVSHRALSAMPDHEIRAELRDSKRQLERVTGTPVRHFAVPANWFDHRVLAMAREEGYTAVWCSRPDGVRVGTGSFGLPRINVEGGVDLPAFRRAISPAGIAQRRLVMQLRGLPKRVVGPRAWTAVRRRLLAGPLGAWLSPRRMAAGIGAAACIVLVAAIWWWWRQVS